MSNPAPMKISLDKIDAPTQASAPAVESAREGKLPRRSMSLGGKDDNDALMKRPLTERRRAKTPPKGALPPLQSKGSMVKLEPLPTLFAQGQKSNIRFGSSSDLLATPPKSPSPEPTTSQDNLSQPSPARAPSTPPPAAIISTTPTTATTTTTATPAPAASSGLSLNIGRSPLPSIGNLSTSISEKSYFEESNIHPDVIVTVNFPNGQAKIMKLKIGETVQEIKRQLWVSHGIPFPDYTLHLQPANKVMIDPLSLNDFPQIEAENKADIILMMKEGKEFKSYAGGADEVNANAQQESNNSNHASSSSSASSSTPAPNLQHIISDAHDNNNNKHKEQHGAPLPGSTETHHGEAHTLPSSTATLDSPKASASAAPPTTSTTTASTDNNKPATTTAASAPTSASNGGEANKASSGDSNAKTSGESQPQPTTKGGCCVII